MRRNADPPGSAYFALWGLALEEGRLIPCPDHTEIVPRTLRSVRLAARRRAAAPPWMRSGPEQLTSQEDPFTRFGARSRSLILTLRELNDRYAIASQKELSQIIEPLMKAHRERLERASMRGILQSRDLCEFNRVRSTKRDYPQPGPSPGAAASLFEDVA